MACGDNIIYPQGNHNVIEIRGLRNTVTGARDEGASVSMTLIDVDGAEVAGMVWPKLLAHVSNGLYRATLDASLEVQALMSYTAVIQVVGSGGEEGVWRCPVYVDERPC